MPKKQAKKVRFEIRADHAMIAAAFISALVSDSGAWSEDSSAKASLKDLAASLKAALRQEIGPPARQRQYLESLHPKKKAAPAKKAGKPRAKKPAPKNHCGAAPVLSIAAARRRFVKK